MRFTFPLLIPAVIAQVFNHIAELVIPIGIPTKDAKAGTEAHPVLVEAKIRKSSITSITLVKEFLVSSILFSLDS